MGALGRSAAGGLFFPWKDWQTLERGYISALVEGPMLSQDGVNLCGEGVADEPPGLVERVSLSEKSLKGEARLWGRVVAQLVVDDVHDCLVKDRVGRRRALRELVDTSSTRAGAGKVARHERMIARK